MSEFYGLVYDKCNGSFREHGVKGLNGIITTAHYFQELAEHDGEPYEDNIDTVEKALEFLDLYNYEIIQVSKEDFNLFESLAEQNDTGTNRLGYDLQEEFYQKAKEFEHKSFQLKDK